jgi:hypothetical protein
LRSQLSQAIEKTVDIPQITCLRWQLSLDIDHIYWGTGILPVQNR